MARIIVYKKWYELIEIEKKIDRGPDVDRYTMFSDGPSSANNARVQKRIAQIYEDMKICYHFS